MTGWSDTAIWVVVVGLGLGTFAIRYSFLGLLGNRDLPEWVLRHLRYTAVGILPALITPMVLWPDATDGQTDPARLTAALVALSAGYLTKDAIVTIVSGLGTLFLLQAVGV
ncbi:AzlD domain-containing protein [Nioella nitratireducens]|uniref:AzlD domain-containing protein n=1 Tax=Nioella nitratireducens TaxID=1287720 RepID=UPI0008FD747D|nr:AzlD domain-containing protein [Nioella nitratireducens]